MGDPALSHGGMVRNTPLVLGGLLAAITLLAGGVALSLNLAANGDELLPMLFGALGAFVVVALGCMLVALRRHRWTIEADAVLVEERPLVPLLGRTCRARIPYAAVAGLGLVQNMRDELLAISTRDGKRYLLAPSVLPTDARLPAIDQAGLAAFAERLRGAMHQAGLAPPPVVEALGFWNSGPGLALLVAAFLASLVLAVGALWALFAGDGDGGRRAGEAVAILVLLPVGLGYVLRAAWRRRQAVRRAMR
jgi:hypothetical protein